MTVTLEQWIEKLRSFDGVPFRHQGRSREAVDCLGLLIVATEELGLAGGAADSMKHYDHMPDFRLFQHWHTQYAIDVPYNRLHKLDEQVQLGDILAFWIDKPEFPRHLAVYTGKDGHGRNTMIHSHAMQRRGVMENVITTAYWNLRVHSAYRLKEFV